MASPVLTKARESSAWSRGSFRCGGERTPAPLCRCSCMGCRLFGGTVLATEMASGGRGGVVSLGRPVGYRLKLPLASLFHADSRICCSGSGGCGGIGGSVWFERVAAVGAWAIEDRPLRGCLMAPAGLPARRVGASQANAARSRVKPRASCFAQDQLRSRRRCTTRPLRASRAAMWRIR